MAACSQQPPTHSSPGALSCAPVCPCAVPQPPEAGHRCCGGPTLAVSTESGRFTSSGRPHWWVSPLRAGGAPQGRGCHGDFAGSSTIVSARSRAGRWLLASRQQGPAPPPSAAPSAGPGPAPCPHRSPPARRFLVHMHAGLVLTLLGGPLEPGFARREPSEPASFGAPRGRPLLPAEATSGQQVSDMTVAGRAGGRGLLLGTLGAGGDLVCCAIPRGPPD